MTAMGHEDAFPPLKLSVGYRFSKPTLAATLGNGEDAPRAVTPPTQAKKGGLLIHDAPVA